MSHRYCCYNRGYARIKQARKWRDVGPLMLFPLFTLLQFGICSFKSSNTLHAPPQKKRNFKREDVVQRPDMELTHTHSVSLFRFEIHLTLDFLLPLKEERT